MIVYGCDLSIIQLIGYNLNETTNNLQKVLYEDLHNLVRIQATIANNINISNKDIKSIKELRKILNELKVKTNLFSSSGSILEDISEIYELIKKLEENLEIGEFVIAHSVLQKIYTKTISLSQELLDFKSSIKMAIKLWLYAKDCIDNVHQYNYRKVLEISKIMYNELNNNFICTENDNVTQDYFLISEALKDIIKKENNSDRPEELLIKLSVINECIKRVLVALNENSAIKK